MDEPVFHAILGGLQQTLTTMQGLLQDTRDRVVGMEGHVVAQTEHRAQVDAKLGEHDSVLAAHSIALGDLRAFSMKADPTVAANAQAIADLRTTAAKIDALDAYKKWIVATSIGCTGTVAALLGTVWWVAFR